MYLIDGQLFYLSGGCFSGLLLSYNTMSRPIDDISRQIVVVLHDALHHRRAAVAHFKGNVEKKLLPLCLMKSYHGGAMCRLLSRLQAQSRAASVFAVHARVYLRHHVNLPRYCA